MSGWARARWGLPLLFGLMGGGLGVGACREDAAPPRDECAEILGAAKETRDALDGMADEAAAEEPGVKSVAELAAKNADKFSRLATSTRALSFERADLKGARDGLATLSELAAKSASELATAVGELADRQGKLEVLEGAANAQNELVRGAAEKLDGPCKQAGKECSDVSAALSGLDAPLPSVVDVGSAARGTRALGDRFEALAVAAEGTKLPEEAELATLAKHARNAALAYRRLGEGLEAFVPTQETVGAAQQKTQEALVRLSAEIDATYETCGVEPPAPSGAAAPPEAPSAEPPRAPAPSAPPPPH